MGPVACVFGQPAVELIVSERTHVFSRVKDVKISVCGNVVLPMGAAPILM